MRTLLAAVEAQIDASAEDDNQRQRNRTRLYTPPDHVRRAEAASGARQGMDLAAARALAAQVAAEDASAGAG